MNGRVEMLREALALVLLAAGIILYGGLYILVNMFTNETRAELEVLTVAIVFSPLFIGIACTAGLFVLGRFRVSRMRVTLILALLLAPPVVETFKLIVNESTGVDKGQHERLTQRFRQVTQRPIEGGQAVTLDVRDITDFSWDRLLWFGPYASGEELNKQLGYVWTHETCLTPSDNQHMLFFLKGNHVVQTLGFTGQTTWGSRSFLPDEAVFQLVRAQGNTGEGRSYLQLFR